MKSKRKVREIVLKSEVCQKFIDLFKRDDVSRMYPGKRDFLKIKWHKERDQSASHYIIIHSNYFVKALELNFAEETVINLVFAILSEAVLGGSSIFKEERNFYTYHT